MSDTTVEPITQIVFEMVREADGSLGWTWDAFGEERLCGGGASSLSSCIDSMRSYLCDEGIAPWSDGEPTTQNGVR